MMFKSPSPTAHRTLAKLLAVLLAYPDATLRDALPEIRRLVADEPMLSAARRRALLALVDGLTRADAIEAQARYVDWFDRGRSTSLHLFEHVHGDSRDRGPAMIDLRQTYEQAGLLLDANELPDYLPVVLEFAAMQPYATARGFLAEMAHILNAIHAALAAKGSPYAAVIAAVVELSGEKLEAVKVTEDRPLDETWAEPEAFDGCATRGQNRPGQPQPVQIVRGARRDAAPQPSAS